MALLSFVKGVNQGATVELVGDTVILGRNEDCHVVLRVPAVSREHAVIRKIADKFYIEDKQSRNKTFVNNKEVKARTPLKDNDKIEICGNVLAFHEQGLRPLLPEHMSRVQADDEDEDSSTIEATIKADSSNSTLLDAQPAERLTMLLEIGAELTQTIHLEPLLPKVVESLFKVFRQADRAFVILMEDGRPVAKVTRTRHANDEGTAKFSRKIVEKCIQTRQAILSEDASADKQFDMSQSIADCKIRSMMCVPLLSRTEPVAFGVIQLDTQNRFSKFTQDDLKVLQAVASQAAIALENARMHERILARAGLERDLTIAKEVQKSFLPKHTPKPDGYEMFAFYQSAQEIGGDYYDFIPLPGGRFGVMIGDVAGKGVPAALMMAKVSAEARFCTLTEPDFAAAVSKLNEHMQEAGELDRFVTFLAADVVPGQHKVTVVNAGHMAPIVYRHATGTFEEATTLDQTGFPLGTLPAWSYEAVSFVLGPGDTVMLYTDGVTDARDKADKEFHTKGVYATLKEGPTTPKTMAERLVAAVLKHSHDCKQHDDITVVAFGRLP